MRCKKNVLKLTFAENNETYFYVKTRWKPSTGPAKTWSIS